nr:hypothetical protein [Acidobacteriota bacterium]
MYMCLAFAVAAHLEPEILIVDEALARFLKGKPLGSEQSTVISYKFLLTLLITENW